MSDKTLKLGLMAPLSGIVSLYGEEIVRAARIACDEVNEQGGVLGRPLQVVVEDDGSLPDTAVPAAEKLIHKHGCTALVGNLLSNSRISVMHRVAEPARIPLMNFSFHEGSILSRYFFNFAALPNQQIDKMIPYIVNHAGPKMFFAGNNYEWPRGSIDAAKRALLQAKGEVVGEEYFPLGSENFDELLMRVARSGADVFVPYAAGNDQLNLLTHFCEKGLKQKMSVVMGQYDEAMASQLKPEVRDGLYSSNTYFMSVDTPENRAYLKRLQALDGVTGIWPEGNGVLTNFGEGAYLCVKAFAAAVNHCDVDERENIVDALGSLKLRGPQGEVCMNPDTHHATVNSYLSVCDRDGRFSIVENFGCFPPVIPERYCDVDGDKGEVLSDVSYSVNDSHLMTEWRSKAEGAEESDIIYDILEVYQLLRRVDAAIITVSTSGVITYANEGASFQFGYPVAELIGLSVHLLVPPHFRAEHRKYFGMFMASDENRLLMNSRGEVMAYRKDGSFFPAAASISKIDGKNGKTAVVTIMDLTERKSNEDNLVHHATHDPLTGLPNRVLIKERLESAIERAQRSETFLAVLFVDLDRFKLVNDNYGHETGDTLLNEASERMLSAVRPGDTVGRFGGDEFVVICDQLTEPQIANKLAGRIVDVFKTPIKFEYGELYMTASVGLAVYDGAEESAESLLRKADTAMYHSKERGRDQWQFFCEEIGEQVKSQLDVTNGLHGAIERDEMFLHYQPIVEVDTREMVGVEALIRWKGADGFVSPEVFIPIAEMSGSILPIGTWVFEQSCKTLALWIARFGKEATPSMSINLSVRQLIEDDIVERFKEIIYRIAVPADKIILEVTETSLISDVEINLRNLTALNRLGIRIAIDDFGTGYSSMGQLKRFPVDNLKIDRSFVNGIENNENDYAISAAVIQMSKALGLKITAEGVETEAQFAILKGMGCHTVQGYLFSRPQGFEEITRLIEEGMSDESPFAASVDVMAQEGERKRKCQKVLS